ncbi:MAG TPA: TlpA disulfide reductase family protein [Vicinamibacterales bacterium]|jgi:peroxiredoxin|nr:TlpA disulfide reductase family protein [Vicinamibacterales bacterium]
MNSDPHSNPEPESVAPPHADSPADAPPAFERFVEGQEALEREVGAPEPGMDRPRPSRRTAWLAMGAVALALVLLYFAPSSQDQSAPPAQTATATGDEGAVTADPDAATDALAVGKPAPLQFVLKDMNGVDVKLASFKGKVILINFWATWCPPCQKEIPDLVDLQQQYTKDLVVLGISIDDPLEKLKPYATAKHVNYPMLMGKDRQDVEDAYGPFFGIPVSVFIDRDGKIWKRHSGAATREQFEREIKALL